VYSVAGLTRQGVWQWSRDREQRATQVAEILKHIVKWRKGHPKMGSRPLYYSILRSGVDLGIGVNKFEQIVREHGLLVGKAKTKKPHSSDGKGKENYDNLTNGLELTGINQLIVLDITYIWVEDRWCYIFSLKDVYSQMVFVIPSENMEAKNALACLDKYVKYHGKEAVKGCIHHSDNGSQYNWQAYKEALKAYGMRISRARQCKENGSSEQSHHICKNMYLEPWQIKTYEQLEKACQKFMDKNNRERAIKQLGYLTPYKFEQKLKEIPMEQRKRKQMHDFDNTT